MSDSTPAMEAIKLAVRLSELGVIKDARYVDGNRHLPEWIEAVAAIIKKYEAPS